MNLWNADSYIKTWNFASKVHAEQRLPGSEIPYINHIGLVAMEVIAALPHTSCANPDLAVQCALLHDTIEDTPCTYNDITQEFGATVAAGVLALSKDTSLGSKAEQMADSLVRIKQQPKEVWMVKLADRITNLQPPPNHWSTDKIVYYQQEARKIHSQLGSASDHLAQRLAQKIAHYDHFSSKVNNL